MKGRILGILILIAWGLVKWPLESDLTAKMQASRLGGFRITAGLREQAGQAGFIAAMGGLRAAVADLLWIRAHMAWTLVQYDRMKLLFDTCTAMQPRRVEFWDSAAWHMAWNGGHHAEFNQDIPDPAVRQKEKWNYWKHGEEYLLRGIANNPDSAELYDRLGMLYRDKFRDHEKASEAFDNSSRVPGHLSYARRFAAYELSKVPGREREAYDRLLALYNEGEHEWLDTLLKQIQEMERKLKIPTERRVYIPPNFRLPPE